MLVDYVSMASPRSCEDSFPLKKAEQFINMELKSVACKTP